MQFLAFGVVAGILSEVSMSIATAAQAAGTKRTGQKD
jgi:hypothetical protein